jgi:hypothetical protein
VVLAALVGLRAIPAAATWARRLDVEVASSRQLVRSEREALGRAGVLEDSGAGVRARIEALAPRILTGAAESQAAADLSGRLGVLATRAKVRLERVDPVPDSSHAGPLHRLTVHATVEGDTHGVLELLRTLGADDLVLTVREMRLVAQDPSSPENMPEVLRGELTVAAWFLTAGRP